MNDTQLKQAIRGVQVGDKVRVLSTRGAMAGFEVGDRVVAHDVYPERESMRVCVRKTDVLHGYCNPDDLEVIHDGQ